VQQGEEAVNRNFLSLEDLQGSQSKSKSSISFCCQPDLQWMEQWMCHVYRAPVRVTYRYLEDDGTKVHMSTGGNASGSIVIPYRVILRETKTTSRVEGLLANLAYQCFCLLLCLHTGGGFELVSVSIYLYARKIIYLSGCNFFLSPPDLNRRKQRIYIIYIYMALESNSGGHFTKCCNVLQLDLVPRT
jgi:hypothetical protein